MSDMTAITCWWQGIPGIDGNCIPGDLTFADRAAAIVCAARLHGALPPETSGPARQAERTADGLFEMFQEAATDQEALRLRLAVAMVCSTLVPGEKVDLSAIKRRARWLAAYMNRPSRKASRRVAPAAQLAG